MLKKKSTILIFLCAVAGIALGVGLLIYGCKIPVPAAEMNFWDVPEYVGGDAFNYMMEASIRGGEIAAATISRAIYICVGSVLALVSTSASVLALLKLSKEETKQAK